MKLLITLLLTLFISASQAKSFVKEISNVVGEKPEVNINIGTWLIKAAMSFSDDEDIDEARAVMRNLDHIKVSVFDLDNNRNTKRLTSLIKSKINNLSSQGYEQLVTIRDDEELVYIVAKVDGEYLQDAMIIAMEEDELVVISLIGEVNLKQLAIISDEYDVDIEDVLDI